MSPIIERYHPRFEKNNSILLPYLWIALVVLIGVLIGTFSPETQEETTVIMILLVMSIGFFIPLAIHILKRVLYSHHELNDGPFYQMVEQISKREMIRPTPDIWIGEEDYISMHVLVGIRKITIAISKSAMEDILNSPEMGEILIAWQMSNERTVHPIIKHVFYSLLFGLSFFFGLPQVDVLSTISQWIFSIPALVSFGLLIIFLGVELSLKKRERERIRTVFGLDPGHVHASIFGGYASTQEVSHQRASASFLLSILNTLVTLCIFILVWETAPWLVSPQPLEHYTVSFIITVMIVTVSMFNLMPLSRLFAFYSRSRFRYTSNILQEVQDILRKIVESDSITVNQTKGKDIQVFDRKGSLFIGGYYELPASVCRNLDSHNKLVAFILSQACIANKFRDYSFVASGGLLQIGLVTGALAIYGYVRADLFVLGGDLSVLLVIITYIVVYGIMIIFLRRRKDIAYERCDSQIYNQYHDLLDSLRWLLESNHSASPGQPTLEFRVDALLKKRGEKV